MNNLLKIAWFRSMKGLDSIIWWTCRHKSVSSTNSLTTQLIFIWGPSQILEFGFLNFWKVPLRNLSFSATHLTRKNCPKWLETRENSVTFSPKKSNPWLNSIQRWLNKLWTITFQKSRNNLFQLSAITSSFNSTI